ncbi:MAG: hypothetical protein AB9869_17780 [Verrucomicrobiia bacterium]
MNAKIEGRELVIRIPIEEQPQPSASGKTLVVATTRGNVRTSITIQGKPVTIGVNAYISAK